VTPSNRYRRTRISNVVGRYPNDSSQLPDRRVPRRSLRPAPPTPVIDLDHPARNYSTLGLCLPADSFQSELVRAVEQGQISSITENVVCVEVLR